MNCRRIRSGKKGADKRRALRQWQWQWIKLTLILGERADFLVNMSASADVLAQAKVEIDLAAIPEGKNVRLSRVLPRVRNPSSMPIRTCPKQLQTDQLGNRQMARQASLHPPSHRRRDPRSRRHQMGIVARPTTRQRQSQEAGMVDHGRYDIPFLCLSFHPMPLTPPFSTLPYLHLPFLPPLLHPTPLIIQTN